MKRLRRSLVLLLCFTFFMSGVAAFAASDDAQFAGAKKQEFASFAEKVTDIQTLKHLKDEEGIVPGKLVVKFKNNNVSVQTKAFQSIGANIVQSFKKADNYGVMTVDLAENVDLEQAMELIGNQSGVEFVEPLYIYKASDEVPEQQTVADAVYKPDDEYYAKKWQWGLQAINIDDLWDRVPVEKRNEVTIAIVDTGVDLDHPDLKDNLVAGYDFVNDDDDPDDDDGHGTHVAGIAAAIPFNKQGIVGVAGGAKIMPVKVLDENGSGSSLSVYLGIMYAVRNGADVINLSLGARAPSLLLKEAIEYAIAHNVVVVAATGNSGEDQVDFPAAFDGVIGVGAIDWNSKQGYVIADFSNYGPQTDVVAPGVDIFSTYPYEIDLYDGNQDGYTLLQGTSMAAPFVAGMAALLRAENSMLTNEQIQQAIEANAYDIYKTGRDDISGAGVINGSDDENDKVPGIIECPNLVLDFSWLNYDILVVRVIALKAKGYFEWSNLDYSSAIIDTEFNGDVSVSTGMLLSEPVSYYYTNIRPILLSLEQPDKLVLPVDGTQEGNEGEYIVSVQNGVGSYTLEFARSGDYIFYMKAGEDTEDRLLMSHNYYYRIVNGDTGIYGTITLDKPYPEDLYIGLIVENQYNIKTEVVVIPKNTTTANFEIKNMIRDTNYLLYCIILDDNDTYLNYSFYKDANTSTHDFSDTTLIDLIDGKKTDANLYISSVEDLEDDIGDTPDDAEEITFEGLTAGDYYISGFKFEYAGDRDYFTFEIPKRDYYGFTAFPLELYSNMENKIFVYDSIMNLLAVDNYQVVMNLRPGRYYLKIEDDTGFNVGDYVFAWGIMNISEPEDEEIEFEDPKLEAAICDYLGLTVGEAVYSSEVTEIEKLDLSGLEISSLKGLEYFTNLWCLELRNNQITDLTPLEGLTNLEILDLKHNRITDISPLCNLYNLEELDVSENAISILPEDFSHLINLYHIDLSHNQIDDVKSLATLPVIETLFLQDNQIASLEGLEGLNTLLVLYLGDNPITEDPSTDYSPLASYYLNLEDKDFFALPTATSVQITGMLRVGNTLTGSYTYKNMNNHEESGTKYQWLRSAEKDRNYEEIAGAVGRTYTLTGDDLDKYIKFRVVPGAAGEPSTGLAAESWPVGPIMESSTSGSGGSGGSGGGGSPQPSTQPTPVPTVTPTPTAVPTPAAEQPAKIETDETGKTMLVVDTADSQITWDTPPVIDATSDSDVDGAIVNLAGDIFRESVANNKPFTVSTNMASFEFQPGAINVPEGTDNVTLTVKQLTVDDIPEASRPADATEVSFVFDFDLTVDGNPVTTFDKPITITLKLDLSAVSNPDKVGVYYYSEAEGKWVFVGGKVNADGTVTFTIDHFSKYLAMEYNITFSDIVDHWAKDAIEVMAARHVTNGTGGDKFSPDAKITRAEFTAMIVRALGIREEVSQNPFVDVKVDDWFADSALKANAAGIIQGDSKGNFAPGNLITREEMAAITVRAYSYYSGVNTDRIITTQEIRFKDMDNASQWAREYITLVDALGLMNGFNDKTFRPKNLSTRAEAIVVVNRLMKLLEIF